jgi:hypothetical protein
MIFSLFSLHNKIHFLSCKAWQMAWFHILPRSRPKKQAQKGLIIWINKIQVNTESKVGLITSNERKRSNHLMLIS